MFWARSPLPVGQSRLQRFGVVDPDPGALPEARNDYASSALMTQVLAAELGMVKPPSALKQTLPARGSARDIWNARSGCL